MYKKNKLQKEKSPTQRTGRIVEVKEISDKIWCEEHETEVREKIQEELGSFTIGEKTISIFEPMENEKEGASRRAEENLKFLAKLTAEANSRKEHPEKPPPYASDLYSERARSSGIQQSHR